MANSNSLDLESTASPNQYATASDSASLSNLGDFTFECWFRPETVSVYQELFAKVTGSAYEYEFAVASDNTVLVTFSGDGTAANRSQFRTTNAQITATATDYHIAAVVDVSVPSAVFYINGASVAVTNVLTASTATSDTTANFGIGTSDTGTPANFLDGLIDDVRIWKGTLRTGAQIDDNNNCALDGTEAGLTAYWKLDNVYTDSTANANTLTASGSPVFSTTVPFTANCTVAAGANNLLLLGVS